MGLVYFIVKRYYPTFIADEDIIQCGMVGLCQASKTWDENRGTFASYASKCIINEIKEELRLRGKHAGVISLECKKYDDDGSSGTIGDCIIGDEDVNFVDFDSFYDQLSPINKEVVRCKQLGMTNAEIAEKLGCSRQNITKRLRHLNHKWRMLNGD